MRNYQAEAVAKMQQLPSQPEYRIVVSQFGFREQTIIELTGLVMRRKGNSAWYETCMSYHLAEAQRVRLELIERGCRESELRVEYA